MTKRIFSLTAAVFVTAVFCFPSFAAEYYSSDESGSGSVPEYAASVSISQEAVTIPESALKNTYELTPEGNLKLVDDYYQTETEDGNEVKSKQFLTVTTKSGNTFYIIVDRDGTNENVHFLNMVDEADLLALMDGEPVSETETESTTKEEETSKEEEEEPAKKENSKGGLILLLAAALGGGGFAFWKFRMKNGAGKTGRPDSDPFYGDSGEETDENEEDSEDGE